MIPRHSRIIALKHLSSYPTSDYLDVTLWLPPDESPRRRIWMMVPSGFPVVAIDDTIVEPKSEAEGTPRWLDYGIISVPVRFTQLRVRHLDHLRAASSHLVISEQLGLFLGGKSLEDAERLLWGLARADAGTTTLSPCRITVGSPVELRVRYAAGSQGLPSGALVRFALPLAFDAPQLVEPGETGYVTVVHADAPVEIVHIGRSTESHEKTDVICRLSHSLEPHATFQLAYRTKTTYLFSHLFHESDRRYWYSKLPPLGAAVAISEDKSFVSVAEANSHCLAFVPGPPERLHLFLPGRRFVGDACTLRGIFTDRYRNTPPSGPPNTDLEFQLVSDERSTPLGDLAGRFVSKCRFEIPLGALAPGVYRAIARQRANGHIVAQSNPLQVITPDNDRLPIYWGEIHAHSEMSDGLGTLPELYRHARDDGCLDFAAASDHACYFSDNQWLWMQDVANSWNNPGRFVTLIGYEWAGKQVHRNVYTSRDRLKLFRGMYEPTSQLNSVWDYFHGDPQVVGGPHGGLAHGLQWQFHDPDVERFVEVYSMWGASDLRDNSLVPEFARRNPRGMTANELLQQGARLGLTGGGDCHEGHAGFSAEDPAGQGSRPHTFAARLLYRCGMTAALAPRLERSALLQAIRTRRTYATTGARMLVEFSISGNSMGTAAAASDVVCQVEVHGVGSVERIEIVKDGDVVWHSQPSMLDVAAEWHDPSAPDREHYYYLHVIQRDGEQAWSSPIWITPTEEGGTLC